MRWRVPGAVVAAMAAVLLVAGTPPPTDGGDTAQRVDIGGGRSLYLRCSGSGSPTVVLLSGLHEASDPWSLTDTAPPVPKAPAVFPGVAAFTRVCTYDRPGTIRYTQPPASPPAARPCAAPERCPPWSRTWTGC
ncbi:hypothetical protein Slala04_28420 [Streptomyces lavendulae subsp. lavendulae]|nr:hypothetical protein Slala04_28420 [Streptomyces lavendulae subsp. lavendulae]